MTFSKLITRTVPHHNKYSSRRGRKPRRGINHHWAGTRGGDTRLINPNEAVSANYILYSDGTLVGQVPEEYRAWTSGSWEADSWSITVEIQNSGGRYPGASDNDPRSWPISDKAMSKLILLWADVATRYGWPTVTRSRIRGHREFAQTACPGGYLWNRLDAIAQAVHQELTVTPDPAPPKPKRRNKMIGITINDGEGRLGPKNKDYYATYDGRAFVQLDRGDANAISVHLDQPFAIVSYSAWNRYYKVAEITS